MPATAWPFVSVESDGIAYVEGTRTKVIEIALDRLAHHWDADEICRQHPHLSLAAVHSALAYYYDHQEACDRLIEDRRRAAEDIRRRTESTSLQDRLRALSRR